MKRQKNNSFRKFEIFIWALMLLGIVELHERYMEDDYPQEEQHETK